ncbi:hypothetical protein [Chondromyces apiculatus]|uniref:Uncharacterized protein n=1 Tax=Chondromyces apiculatus DSM 436 TaxID=1192034 RepID=A0A017SZQ4_9BACT|nr:hypothetical protein [Chondromyces apiculatus]EYF02464.1 Hypothetical protein CAP_7086 [Chondromyces apiculatus DSM 436]
MLPRHLLRGASAVSFLLALCLTGCLPIPHTMREAPALHGTLQHHGTPLARALVRRSINPPYAQQDCAGGEETRTAANGTFSFPEERYFTPVIMFGDRRDTWRLCIALPGGGEAVWQDDAWWGGPPEQRLTCEVGAPSPIAAAPPSATAPSTSAAPSLIAAPSFATPPPATSATSATNATSATDATNRPPPAKAVAFTLKPLPHVTHLEASTAGCRVAEVR